MVEAQRRSGDIGDERVLQAMDAIPREEFVPPALRDEAYQEHALPIGSDQTISQPHLVAMMTDALATTPDDHVLEVGTGSGYQAAILSLLVDRVTSIERIEALATEARTTLDRLDIANVTIHVGDGSLGWPASAPYDGIVVTAGAPTVPTELLDQLTIGGRLVLPVGPRGAERLARITRTRSDEFERVDLGAVSFVPLVGEQGW
jgi:protein-L-isoaspartate(D-aspartate) O-methyltransferase